MKVNNKYLFIILAFAGLLLATCKKEQETEREYPRVNTLEVKGISENGATFEADIYSPGNEGIIDHGFVWGTSKVDLSIENSDRISLGTLSGIGKYDAQIRSTLESKKQYYVRSFVKTPTHTIYGSVVSFVSLGSEGPMIIDFEPKTAGWGDTITIKGQYFGFKNKSNKVYFLDKISEIVSESCTDTSLKVIIPYLLNNIKSIISIEDVENIFFFEKDSFQLIQPTITDVDPTEGYWGDTITIYGKKLDCIKKLKSNGIQLSQTQCISDSIISATKDSITFKIPCNLASLDNQITVNINSITTNSPKSIKLLSPRIINFSPQNATWDSELTLYGRFNPMKQYSSVLFNNIPATITNYSKDSIKIRVPNNLNVSSSTITYKSNNLSAISEEKFQLSPPTITSVAANETFSGSSITINGGCFNNGMTSVSINNVAAQVYSCTSNTIVAKIPDLPNEQITVKVTVAGQTATFNSNTSIENPIITSFTPNTATFGDTIYINGNFLDKIDIISLAEQNTLLNIAYQSPNRIKATILNETNSTPSKVKGGIEYLDDWGNYRYYDFLSIETFTLAAPIISSISPESGTGEQEVRLTGSNFNPDNSYMEVFFGNSKASIIYSGSKNELYVKLNKVTNGPKEVKLLMNGYNATSGQMYNCTSPWSEINNLPFQETIIGSFSINNKGYTVSYNLYNYQFSLRSFDPEANSWSTLSAPPKTSYSVDRYTAESFEVGGKIYFFQASNRIDYFDIESGSWIQTNNFPGSYGTFSFSFKINDKLYIINEQENLNVWEFNSTTNTWTQKGNIPDDLKAKIFVRYFLRTTTFSINGKGYVIAEDKSVWEYTPELDTWIRKNDFPGQARFNSSTFSLNNKAYVLGGSHTDHTPYDENWVYDYFSDTWDRGTDIPSNSNYDAINFVLNNEIYFGGGTTSTWYINLDNFYKYDPSLEK